MIELRQSTAVTLKVGPFLDSTDGDTEETALTINQADVLLSKNGGALAQKNEASASAHDANGNYNVALNTTDTNTLGILKIYIHVTGALAVWKDFMVVPANTYDSLILGADNLNTNTSAIKKNTALANVPFVMVDNDDNPLTGLTITAERSIDGGAFAACANSAAEVSNGAYEIDLAASDLNGDTIMLKFSATGAKITWAPIYTKS